MIIIKRSLLMSLLVLVASNAHCENYKNMLSNHRLVLSGAESSGIEFKGYDRAVMYAEMTGEIPIVEARVKWITDNVFYMVENGRGCKECPPRTWLYKIEKIKNGEVSLLEFDNLWPPSKDISLVYTLRPSSSR